jgi:hypothetical protein
MFPFEIRDIFLVMAVCMFVLGILSIFMGMIVLVTKSTGGDVKVLAQQTAKLAQKGLTEEVAGLVGNASSLVDAMNQLATTATGVGIFLIITGFIFSASAYFLVTQAVNF